MSNEITTHFVREYNAGVRMLQQQRDTRLMMAVMVDPNVEGDRAFFDQVDAVAMNEVTNRHGDTEYTETPHRRRMVTLRTYEVADLVDRADRRRLLNDPINPYTRSQAAAANRRLDDIIISAFDATAKTGADGDTDVVFDTAFSFNATGGGAQQMSIADLTNARNLLEAAENDEDDGDYRWYGVLTAKSRQHLLDEDPTAGPSVTSSDYAAVKALVNGQVDTFLGFKFLKSQRMDIDGSNIRDNFFWVKSSMQLAVGQEPRSFIDVIPQKRHSIQVRHELDGGATRMDEKGVVRILVDES